MLLAVVVYLGSVALDQHKQRQIRVLQGQCTNLVRQIGEVLHPRTIRVAHAQQNRHPPKNVFPDL